MPTGEYQTITYEVDGHKATITLNRPDALNALSPFMITERRAAYDAAENDDDVWLLIVTASGRAFCTGADVKEIPEDGKVINERPYLSSYDQWEAPQEGTPPFRRMAKPVIVAVNGICCGAGLDWVTTGDIVIASDQATFFDPHVSIGLVAGREMVRLARVLPRSVALRMAIMGKHERMSAERAYELGLITEIVPHDRLLARAREIADTVNRNAPLAVRGTRLAVIKGREIPMHEAEMLAEAFRERNLHTEDSLEGPKAFVEKREPNWRCR
ncbi:MAG: enoyl-CoA hydratase/isomerase family protein [Mycobacterium sp.]|nr:MAG: enoyl-CoA hydratase/isomerase family protein [Mycobacterium sp.]